MTKLFLFISVVFSLTIFAQDSIKLKIYRENVGKTYYLYADNLEHAPVSVEYSYSADNMTSTLPDKSVVVVPGLTRKFLLSELKSVNPALKSKFSYSAEYVLGDVFATGENEFLYQLPFEKNRAYRIYQGYNGKFSHQNAYSVDFSLQSGDKIYAARSGKVVTVVAQHSKNCLTKDCAVYNNKIIILHTDGTLAEYVHLKQNGATVKPGDEVAVGQHIGFSGNTGWSKGPHLHFSVFINRINGERRYIKTRFKTDGNKAPVYLSEGSTYSRSF